MRSIHQEATKLVLDMGADVKEIAVAVDDATKAMQIYREAVEQGFANPDKETLANNISRGRLLESLKKLAHDTLTEADKAFGELTEIYAAYTCASRCGSPDEELQEMRDAAQTLWGKLSGCSEEIRAIHAEATQYEVILKLEFS